MENPQGPHYSAPPPSQSEDGKTAAIIAYITVIGWLISYFALYREGKTQLAAVHLRQTLFLYLIGIGWYFVQMALLFTVPGLALLGTVVNIALFVFWLLGLIAAIGGQAKPMPVIGEPAQRMFSSI